MTERRDTPRMTPEEAAQFAYGDTRGDREPFLVDVAMDQTALRNGQAVHDESRLGPHSVEIIVGKRIVTAWRSGEVTVRANEASN